MNRDLFKEEWNFQMSERILNNLTVEQQLDIIKESIKVLDEKCPGGFYGYHSILIVQEELAELIQELSKALRSNGTNDSIGIIEELADVSLCIDYVKEVFGITDKQLHHARTVKIRRLKNNLADSDYV